MTLAAEITTKVVTPLGETMFVDPSAAMEWASKSRDLNGGPATVFVRTTDDDWMETDW